MLYQLARIFQTLSAVLSGSPERIGTRAKNIAVGRLAARGGVWARLWGRW